MADAREIWVLWLLNRDLEIGMIEWYTLHSTSYRLQSKISTWTSDAVPFNCLNKFVLNLVVRLDSEFL